MCESFEQDKLMFKMMMDFPVITLQNAFYLSLIGKKCGSKKHLVIIIMKGIFLLCQELKIKFNCKKFANRLKQTNYTNQYALAA